MSRIPGGGRLRFGAIAQLQLQRGAEEQAHSGATETTSKPHALERDTLHHWLSLGVGLGSAPILSSSQLGANDHNNHFNCKKGQYLMVREQVLAKLFCKRPDSGHFRLCGQRASVATSCLCHYSTEAATDIA